MVENHSFAMDNEIEVAIGKLLAYCKANDWAGYDPYDALNSKILKMLPVLDSRVPRIVLTQALKRSPVNIRPLLLIGKTQNPKAIGLFLSALLNLEKLGLVDEKDLIGVMIERLVALRSKGLPYWCWGYSFPWQTRTIIVPAGAPNLVCTCFVANALLDAYERNEDSRCLSMAMSAADYVVNELYWSDDGGAAGFSYPQRSLRIQVHNANFLGAALLCRVYKHSREERLLDATLRVARYSSTRQRADGSWDYGEEPSQRWIDNFHTGYNLCALHSISRDADTPEFEAHIRRGFEFYVRHFFHPDGSVKYFHDRAYPIDIHCVAQSIITLMTLKDLDPGSVAMARAVFRWAMKYMWDNKGFFYYRILRVCTIRTSYMRWSQAWMLLAASTILHEANVPVECPRIHNSTAFAQAC
ncbi:MAG TPA: hypothetical protein VJO16_06680 [Candidatus Acidoferrum sp.]|nr:hypothetical protein [Candidatus Acidoferrum sp.]